MTLIPWAGVLDILVFLVILGFFIYKYSTRNFDYWKKKGVSYVKPFPFIGNLAGLLTFRSSIGQFFGELYSQFKTPYLGIFILNKPGLMVRSPDLIRSILVKDFEYFYDRSVMSDESCDPVASKMLFFAKNPEWKQTRIKMTPVFSSGKIKIMLTLINTEATEMINHLNKIINSGAVEMREICAKYSTNVISSCAFGLDARSFESEDAKFRAIGRKMFEYNWGTAVRQTCYFVAPGLAKMFKLAFFDPGCTQFLRTVFWKTVEDREKSNFKRNDFVDIMNQIRKQNSSSNNSYQIDGDNLLAQACQFFVAGFETVSSTISFALYELSLQPKLQSRLRSEIKAAMEQHGGLTYEAIQENEYLQMVVSETLRKYPALPFLDRMCTADYKVPDSDFVIEKGTPIYIPMMGLHYDSEYFPNPKEFDPERFSSENKLNVTNFTYFPFGDGPRNCIGNRMGYLTVKVALCRLLLEYEFEKCAETPVPIVFQVKAFLLASDVGLPMKLRKAVSLAA